MLPCQCCVLLHCLLLECTTTMGCILIPAHWSLLQKFTWASVSNSPSSEESSAMKSDMLSPDSQSASEPLPSEVSASDPPTAHDSMRSMHAFMRAATHALCAMHASNAHPHAVQHGLVSIEEREHSPWSLPSSIARAAPLMASLPSQSPPAKKSSTAFTSVASWPCCVRDRPLATRNSWNLVASAAGPSDWPYPVSRVHEGAMRTSTVICDRA